jgi:hypothetical protein
MLFCDMKNVTARSAEAISSLLVSTFSKLSTTVSKAASLAGDRRLGRSLSWSMDWTRYLHGCRLDYGDDERTSVGAFLCDACSNRYAVWSIIFNLCSTGVR